MKHNKKALFDCLIVATCVNIFLVGLLTIFLFLKTSEADAVNPLELNSLENLKTQAQSDLKNEDLKTKIRTLDLVARKQWLVNLTIKDKLKKFLALAMFTLVLLLGAIAVVQPRIFSKQDLDPAEPNPGGETLGLAFLALACILIVNASLFWSYSSNNKDSEKSVFHINHDELKKFWPGFRGIYNTGISDIHKAVSGWGKNMATSTSKIAEVPLPGFSSPIYLYDKLYLTGGDETKRALFCLNASDGKLLWTHETNNIDGSPKKLPKVTEDTGYAAATPVTNGKAVFAIFATGNLIATDLNGKRIWAKNIGVPDNIYGYCSSLLAFESKLIVQYDNDDKQIIYCFNAADGKQIWQHKRKSPVSWSSPSICDVKGKKLVITLNCRDVEGFDLESGKKLWGQKIMGGEVAPSATCDKGIIYVANQYVVAAAIEGATGKILWKNSSAILPDVCSPVVYKDMLYLFTSDSTISCLDTKDGKVLWEKEVKNGFYSSPLVLSDKIIAFDLKGNMLCIKPDRSQIIIESTDSLGVSVLSTPAIGHNQMWVRTNKGIFHIKGD